MTVFNQPKHTAFQHFIAFHFRHYSTLGPRSDKNWVYSDLVQSYLDYLLSDDDVFQVSQPAFKSFVNHCITKGEIDAIIDLHL